MQSGLLLDPSGFDSGAPSFTFSSHPAIAWPTRTQAMGNVGLDPKGLTYEPVWSFEGDWEERVQPLFPGLAAWKCRANRLERPDTLKATALYLTATSTVMESHLPSELPSYASGTLLTIHADGASQAPTTTSSPLISKPEEAATSLPETPSGNTPTSNSAVPVTSAMGLLGSQQVPSRAPKDAAATSPEVADGNLPTSAVEATSPTRVLSSEQLSSRPVASVSTPIVASSENVGQPAVILTTTNPKGSPIVTTLAATGAALGNDIAPIIFNSHIISTDANAHYLVSGQPLIPGSPVTLGSGAGATPVVLHTSSSQTFLVVGSSTSILAGTLTSAAIQALSIGTQVLAANSENLYVVGTQTLAPGVPITIGSGDAATPVEMHTSSSHTVLVFGSRTQTLFAGPTPLVPAALTIGSQVVGVNSEGGYIVGSQTLAPGVPITLGSGSDATPFLLQTTSSNTVLIIGSITSTLIAAATVTPQPLTIGSQVISINSQNQYIVGSQTLTPGSPITLGSGVTGTPVLLQTSGTQTILVAGSITSTLAGAATAPPRFTIGSQVVTANAQNQYVVGSQTLTPGAAITVAGTPVSLASSGTQVVVGTSTDGLGNYIMSGLGAGPSASASASASGAVPFKGSAGRQFQSMGTSAVWGSAMAVLMLWLEIGIM